MFRPSRFVTFGWPIALAWLAAGGGAIADEPKAQGPPPVVILLETPADFEAFLKKIARPDYVIETGAQFDRRVGANGPKAGPPSVVESIDVRGEVIDDLAHLVVDVVSTARDPGPTRLAIGLEGATVVDAVEGDRVLPASTDAGAWEVELKGAGRHAIRVRALARVSPGFDGARLEFGIPQAAGTSIELTINAPLKSAAVGPREPLAMTPAEGGRSTRVSAHLTPRKRIDLTWATDSPALAQGEPQLTANGEIELTVDPGSIRSRANWAVSCERGTARSIVVRLEPGEALLDLEVDGRPLSIQGVSDSNTGLATIPIPSALAPGSSLRLVFSTRRPVAPGGASRIEYRGMPIQGAIAQSGVIAVARSGELDLFASPGPGMRQLDPVNDLSQTLRSRPGVVLAYQFYSQPIGLSIRAEPSPPRVWVDSSSRIRIGPTLAKVESRLEYRVVGGSAFQVEVEVPAGLEWETAGPDDVVSMAQLLPEASTDPTVPSRILCLTLSAKARESRTFAIVLAGRQPIEPSGVSPVGLFRARHATGRGSLVVVDPAAGIEADLADGSAFVPAPVAGSSWLAARAGESAASRLSLRDDGNPPSVPLRVLPLPRTIRARSSISARFRRRGVEVVQGVDCRARNGTISALDVEIPPAASEGWELVEPAAAGRRRLPDLAGRGERYRIRLPGEGSDVARLVFRLRLPPGSLSGRDPAGVAIPCVKVLDAEGERSSYRIASDEGIVLEPVGSGWSRPEESDPADGGARPWVRSEEFPGPALVSARSEPLARLPSVVASRLWLRTSLGPSSELRTSAWYRLEPGESDFSFRLPEGSTLLQAWVDGEPAREVGTTAEGAYRLTPGASEAPKSRHVCLEYETPKGRSSGAWAPPILAGGGLVRQTFWTARLPWSHAAIGVPGGWTDENRWDWSTYAWMRRPVRGDDDLAGWITGDPGPPRPEIVGAAGPGSHEYLFGRPGDAAPLPIRIASRATLVGVCSGTSLILGLALVSWRVSPSRLAASASVAILSACVLLDPSVVLLGVESGAIGLVLALLAPVTKRLVDRPRGLAPAAYHEPASPADPPGFPRFSPMPDLGSEDSTVVRRPVGSTAEHVPIARDEADGRAVGDPPPRSPRPPRP